jgi:predicted nucleic acid-binding protein
MTRRVVLDANILIRASLGSRVGQLILEAQRKCDLFTPEVCALDAEKHLVLIADSRGIAVEPMQRALRTALVCVEVLDSEFTATNRALCEALIRDPDDWPVLSAAIALGATVWSEDQDFFGTDVPSLVCRNVQRWLSSPVFGSMISSESDA